MHLAEGTRIFYLSVDLVDEGERNLIDFRVKAKHFDVFEKSAWVCTYCMVYRFTR